MARKRKSNGGSLGLVLGGLAVVGGGAGLAVYLWRRRSETSSSTQLLVTPPPSAPPAKSLPSTVQSPVLSRLLASKPVATITRGGPALQTATTVVNAGTETPKGWVDVVVEPTRLVREKSIVNLVEVPSTSSAPSSGLSSVFQAKEYRSEPATLRRTFADDTGLGAWRIVESVSLPSGRKTSEAELELWNAGWYEPGVASLVALENKSNRAIIEDATLEGLKQAVLERYRTTGQVLGDVLNDPVKYDPTSTEGKRRIVGDFVRGQLNPADLASLTNPVTGGFKHAARAISDMAAAIKRVG